MRLRAVYAFQPPPYGDRMGARGSVAPTQYVTLSGVRSEADIRDLGIGGTSLVWGHVVEVQESEAIFVTTAGQLERVPIQYLVLIDFIEQPV